MTSCTGWYGRIRADAERIASGPNRGPVRYVVAAAYYLSPAVRAALDYDPERVIPVRPFDFPTYLEEGLLDHLLEEPSTQ